MLHACMPWLCTRQTAQKPPAREGQPSFIHKHTQQNTTAPIFTKVSTWRDQSTEHFKRSSTVQGKNTRQNTPSSWQHHPTMQPAEQTFMSVIVHMLPMIPQLRHTAKHLD